jgi:inorganic pyrophosphatase
VYDIWQAITIGAETFLYREYIYMAVFIVMFGSILLLALGMNDNWTSGIFTTIAFVAGAVVSIVAGYVGMKVAVFANARTALQAQLGYGPAFVTAFRAGAVIGFALVSMGMLGLWIIMQVFGMYWPSAYGNDGAVTKQMFECIAGYGLGGSSIALFGRVGGGIYTKAADVGADLCGKLEFDLPEDDPRNPAVIADNVGDNVGDVAGMGADLFGSFAEATCAAMVISSQSPELNKSSVYMLFPLMLTAAGTMVCLLTSFVATDLMVVRQKHEIERK